jgi:carbon monoxide dehydrogenase subunit G
MALKIEKTFQVKEPMDVVWALLSNPAKVATCVPGAQITDQVDDTHYQGAISVKVGPAVMDFKGELQIVRLDSETHIMEMLGKGQDLRGKGSASMKMTGSLRALSDGGTEVISVSEVNVVGLLAQMGGRVINEVSNIMFQKFAKNFQEKLEQEVQSGEAAQAGGAAKPINAVSVAFSAIKAAMKRNKPADDSSGSAPEADPQQGTSEADEPQRKAQ